MDMCQYVLVRAYVRVGSSLVTHLGVCYTSCLLYLLSDIPAVCYTRKVKIPEADTLSTVYGLNYIMTVIFVVFIGL